MAPRATSGLAAFDGVDSTALNSDGGRPKWQHSMAWTPRHGIAPYERRARQQGACDGATDAACVLQHTRSVRTAIPRVAEYAPCIPHHTRNARDDILRAVSDAACMISNAETLRVCWKPRNMSFQTLRACKLEYTERFPGSENTRSVFQAPSMHAAFETTVPAHASSCPAARARRGPGTAAEVGIADQAQGRTGFSVHRRRWRIRENRFSSLSSRSRLSPAKAHPPQAMKRRPSVRPPVQASPENGAWGGNAERLGAVRHQTRISLRASPVRQLSSRWAAPRAGCPPGRPPRRGSSCWSASGTPDGSTRPPSAGASCGSAR